MKKLLFVLISTALAFAVCAQDTLTVPADIQHAFNNQTRSTTGAPGPKYWQNKADYDLNVSFDPNTRLVKGTANIVYRNNSPDTLRELWFKLYPNLYKRGVPSPKAIKPEDKGDGMIITSMKINKAAKDTATFINDGTNMHLPIEALMPGKSVTLNISYYYTLNKGSHMRTGQVDEGSDFIAYFFPRIAVYDDVDGWNKYPYRGTEEFYNDFCNFKASITVPKDYVVWATGDLQNEKQVFSKRIISRIYNAEHNDAIIYVIDSTDQKKDITKQNKFNTWKYSAKNVTDLVVALSDHYLWQSTSMVVDPKTGRRTRVDAAFNPKHADYFDVIGFARKTVYDMSYKFPAWPYPYPHETVFDGLDQMEYPMMVNDNPEEKRFDAITLTDHEIFHTMFPFYMGINETKYGWMDEGWATIGEWLISPMIDDTLKDDYGIEATAKSSGDKDDVPIMALTTDLTGRATFTNSYPKPAFGYLYVKDYLGDELFTKALHHYIEQWQGKHPTPFDFFYSMNEGSGKNMNWFWMRWFFGEGVTDMGITGVKKTADGYSVTVENKSMKPMPVDLTVIYSDGSEGVFHKSIGVWQLGQQSINVLVTTAKAIKEVRLGAYYTPDKDKRDNVYLLK